MHPALDALRASISALRGTRRELQRLVLRAEDIGEMEAGRARPLSEFVASGGDPLPALREAFGFSGLHPHDDLDLSDSFAWLTLQCCVNLAAQLGGGTVLVPADVFYCRRPVILRSGMTLRGIVGDRSTLVNDFNGSGSAWNRTYRRTVVAAGNMHPQLFTLSGRAAPLRIPIDGLRPLGDGQLAIMGSALEALIGGQLVFIVSRARVAGPDASLLPSVCVLGRVNDKGEGASLTVAPEAAPLIPGDQPIDLVLMGTGHDDAIDNVPFYGVDLVGCSDLSLVGSRIMMRTAMSRFRFAGLRCSCEHGFLNNALFDGEFSDIDLHVTQGRGIETKGCSAGVRYREISIRGTQRAPNRRPIVATGERCVAIQFEGLRVDADGTCER